MCVRQTRRHQVFVADVVLLFARQMAADTVALQGF